MPQQSLPVIEDLRSPLISGGYVTRSGSNLLFAPEVSNKVYLYEDSIWKPKLIPDVGITTGATGLTASTDYFLYVYDNSGTLTLDLSTTYPTTTQNGIQVKGNTTVEKQTSDKDTNATYYSGVNVVVVDRSWAVDNSSTVEYIGCYSNIAKAMFMYVLQRTAANTYSVVAKESVTHTGSGWEWFKLTTPYSVPASGDFYAASGQSSISIATSHTSNKSLSRAYYNAGIDISGSGITFTEPAAGGVFPVGVLYSSGSAATDRLLIARCATNSSGNIVSYLDDATSHLINNVFNKRKISLVRRETSASTWTYASATFRPMNNSTANRIQFVSDGKNAVNARMSGRVYTPSTAGYVSISIDGTASNEANFVHQVGYYIGVATQSEFTRILAAGYHFLQAVEASADTNSVTFASANGLGMSGISAEIMA